MNNRLAEVTDLAGNPVASYRHNAFGQRQIKVVGGETTYFVFDLAGRLLAEIDAATGDETDHVYNAGERIATIQPDGTILWHHNDHLGTPMSLTDAAGVTVWKASYTPFGLATVNDDPDGNGVSVTNNLRFQGQYFDAETGLHYNYHRTYDPVLGRYTQADPIGLNGGANRFGYVSGNPVKFVDPLGLVWQTASVDYHHAKNSAIGITQYIGELIDNNQVVAPGPNSLIGSTRTITQEWVHDESDPCADSAYPIGTLRVFDQTFMKHLRTPKDLVSDPRADVYYQWTPMMSEKTYIDVPSARLVDRQHYLQKPR
ncbi:RHS repeat-associated core domain-containing protein [Mariprofundus ferrooxydans]|uniref:RHS repeat-associated core domain-containing protein n=1 Tax=Mariprofundus ferrooxydans TaxID=314344 RepID=UPI0018C97F41|nr:RHS repeat-associated core domain-containing protein [Mariprofundus ferrooxydans]